MTTPVFVNGLLAKLRSTGVPFTSINSVSVLSTALLEPAFSAEVKDNPLGNPKMKRFLWDIFGGSLAVVVLIILIVHFRYSYWYNHIHGGTAGSLLNRFRQNGERVGR